jgi:UDP-N-acetylmuramyl pentapeptide phosphotransferase/UDP-N-acetylglucosamine-1-phosphate transferase
MAFTFSMLLAMFVIPKILMIAVKYSLYDIPNERKTHKGAIPRLGGIAFLPCILFATMFTLGVFYRYPLVGMMENHSFYPENSELYLFFGGLILLYLGGAKDDLIGLRYRHKFALQIISSILVAFSGSCINNLYGFFGIYELTPWIGLPLTVFVLVLIINAMNLIDGIDGLASGLSLFALTVYGVLFLLHGFQACVILAFSTIGVLIPFFYYNVYGDAKRKRKLFMGDSGSLTLGLILGFLAVRYACYRPDIIRPVGNILVIAVSPILVPLLDMMRVILVRIKNKKHLFKADRNHIHHKLINLGMKELTVVVVLFAINVGLCIINVALINYLNNTFIFLIDITLWTALNTYFTYKIKKRQEFAPKITKTMLVRASGTE